MQRETVISGVSDSFPDAGELRDKLLAGVDLASDDERPWKPDERAGGAKGQGTGRLVLEERVFVPYEECVFLDASTALQACLQVALANLASPLRVACLAGNGMEDQLLRLLDSQVLHQDWSLLSELQEGCGLVVAADIVQRSEQLGAATAALAEGGFLLSSEQPSARLGSALQLVMRQTCGPRRLLLLRKRAAPAELEVVTIGSQQDSANWLQTGGSSRRRVVLVAQRQFLSGVLGLVPTNATHVRCFLILDTMAPLFDPALPFYRQQLDKDLVVNVYSEGKWGAYHHLPLSAPPTLPVPHAYVTPSCLQWVEGRLHPVAVEAKPAEALVHVYYSGVNVRDVLAATGLLGPADQDGAEGMEFSGRDLRGRRVAGLVPSSAPGSMVLAHRDLLWDVPHAWSLEDAATVPVAYAMAYYALMVVGHLEPGASVLIHAGARAVGQAAIRLALHAGCTVFTTAGSQPAHNLICKLFPQLQEQHIGSSVDTSFEQLVMRVTDGRGVDLVLNGLSDERLQASLRCLAMRGHFLEISTSDVLNNSVLCKQVFLREAEFHRVSLTNMFQSVEHRRQLQEALRDGIASGVVQPLDRTVFTHIEVERAFRHAASQHCVDKVLIRIRPEEDKKQTVPLPVMIRAQPRFYCNPEKSYVLVGGLGSLGMELADWLVRRGARKLALPSGADSQSWRIAEWRDQGVTVAIPDADVTSSSGITAVLSAASQLGPVDAIFCLPECEATSIRLLDPCSRHMCVHLRHFVAFCTARSWDHAVMERVCMARDRDGFPALAVHLGPLEGHPQDHGTGGMSSCLEALDRFMRQPHVSVASVVLPQEEPRSLDMVQSLKRILGVEAVSPQASLAELGVDTIAAQELQQLMQQRGHSLSLTAAQLGTMTVAQLQQLDTPENSQSAQGGHCEHGLPTL